MTNDKYPIVSICCLSYNHAPFVRKALEGFLIQEPPTGVAKDEPWLEILIHDDASTDGTDAIIRECAAKNPDKIFPLYEKENQYTRGGRGHMDFYNYNRARGKYLATCEADDCWIDSLKLRKQVDFMELHPEYSVCWHRVSVVDPYDKIIRDGKADRLFVNKQNVSGVDIDIPTFFDDWYTQPCSMMIRRASLDYTWHTMYKTYCDTYEIYHLLKVGRGHILNFVGANYRIQSGGVASSMSIIRSCLSELGYIEELYHVNKDSYTKNYWQSVLLWTIETLMQNNEKHLAITTLWREFKLFPLQTIRIIFTLCKRSIKAYVKKLLNKVRRMCLKMRFRPIRVFVFHHVNDVRDILVCKEDDWTQLDQFKQNIEKLSKQYKFISLSDAFQKLQNDKIRRGKYAVLTTDDGLSSIMNIIPWLEEKGIPLTLFINSRYMDGDIIKPIHSKWLHEFEPNADVKAIAKKTYLSKEQIWALNSPKIEIGLHGHEHLDATQISESAFEKDLALCMESLSEHPRFIPAFAYTWGKSTLESMNFLHHNDIIPLLVAGKSNYQWDGYIDRECIDNIKL